MKPDMLIILALTITMIGVLPSEAQIDVRATSSEQASPVGTALRIAAGDLLAVSVFGTDYGCAADKQVNCEARVSSSGTVSLPLIGSVAVEGQTTEEAARSIASVLSKGGYFNNPQVIVVQREYATQGIAVLGEVQKPGIYPLIGSHTLLEAISAAGGTTAKAGNKVLIRHRAQPNQPENINLRAANSNQALLPGDTVEITKAGMVYVVGEGVKQPMGVVMENSGLTVLQALAMAQGTSATAKLNGAMLIRTTNGQRTETPIALGKLFANKAPDPVLQPEDIVFVPSSAAKSVTRRSLEAIIQTATGVAVYRPY